MGSFARFPWFEIGFVRAVRDRAQGPRRHDPRNPTRLGSFAPNAWRRNWVRSRDFRHDRDWVRSRRFFGIRVVSTPHSPSCQGARRVGAHRDRRSGRPDGEVYDITEWMSRTIAAARLDGCPAAEGGRRVIGEMTIRPISCGSARSQRVRSMGDDLAVAGGYDCDSAGMSANFRQAPSSRRAFGTRTGTGLAILKHVCF